MKNEIVESFEDRLKYAMSIRGKRQIDIANHFGWSRSTVSQYCDPSVNHRPKADRTYQLAEYLNVNPAWLMGYDVPMNALSEREKLLTLLSSMSDEEIQKISMYAEMLNETKDITDNFGV